MTENEKLRALLAEARVALQGVAAYDANPDVSWTMTKEDCRDALDRIDAALAEPVEPSESEYAMHARIRADYDKTVADSWRAHSAKLESERDEARAEVKRLKESNKLLRVDADKEWGAAATAVATAYQRGAEAMREAAARVVDGDPVVLRSYRSVQAGRIRALPLPEDKP